MSETQAASQSPKSHPKDADKEEPGPAEQPRRTPGHSEHRPSIFDDSPRRMSEFSRQSRPRIPCKVYVVFYSMYGHVYQLAEAVAEGARLCMG